MAIFRDERVLRPGDDLPSGIRAGLEESEFLVFLASKEAAESDWVSKELRIWCDELKRTSHFLPVHISDHIKVDIETSRLDWENTDAIPAGIDNLQILPVWTDMTWASKEEHLDLSNVRYKAEINAIVASLRGVLPGTMNDIEVLTHRRNILARNIGIGLVFAFAAVAVWFGIQARRSAAFAEGQRLEAIRQAGIAVRAQKEAEGQRGVAEEQRKAAVRQAEIAKDQRDTAVAEQLIAQSNEMVITRPGNVIDATALLLQSAASRPSPEAGFALREQLGHLARPVFQNGVGSPGIAIPFFFDGVAGFRKDNSGQLEYIPWTVGQSIGRPDEPVELQRARINKLDTVVVVTAGTASWARWRRRGELGSIPTKDYRVFDVAFPSSGRPKLAGSRDGTSIEIYEFGKQRPTLSIPHGQPIDLLVYSSDAKWLAAARFKLETTGNGPASEVTIFEAETGKEWTRLKTSGTISDFAFSPVGEQAAALEGGTVVVWDIAKKSPPRELDRWRGDTIDFLSGWDRVFFSADGKSIGAAGDSRLRIWDSTRGHLKMKRDLGGVIRWVSFSDRGNLAAVTGAGGDIQVWDIEAERMISLVPAMPGRTLFPVRFGHVNQMLQVTDERSNAQLWQIGDEQETWRWPHLPLSWLPDSRRFLVSEGNEFYLWNADRGSATVSNEMPATVTLLAVRPGGKMVAVADAEGSVRVFNLPDLVPEARTNGGAFPRVLQWAPDGGSLVAVADRRLSFWSSPGLRERSFEPAAYDPDKLIFSPDGRYCTVGYAPRNYGGPGSVQPLQLWDTRTGKVIRQVAHGQVPEYVAFAPHAPYLVTSAEGLIRIWRYPDLKELVRWKASQGFHSITLSPDGSTIAAVLNDRIGLWKVPSGEKLGTITPDGKQTSVVAFTPDSRAIVAVSDIAEDSALTQAWSWPELKLIARFLGGSGSGPEISFSPDGAYLVLHQIDHLERYLWRTEDLIPQGCRTLREIAGDRPRLPSWCGAQRSQALGNARGSARNESNAGVKGRSGR